MLIAVGIEDDRSLPKLAFQRVGVQFGLTLPLSFRVDQTMLNGKTSPASSR